MLLEVETNKYKYRDVRSIVKDTLSLIRLVKATTNVYFVFDL